VNQKKQGEAILRIHPFPTLIAQALQLASFAGSAHPGAAQVLAKSAIVFASMSLECAATSCLELTGIPKGPHGKIDRTLSVVDKFDMLHWLAVRTPLDRGRLTVQKIDDLVAARNMLVHPRVRREPIGACRHYAAGEGIDAGFDKTAWNALRIPKDERSWSGEHAENAIVAVVDFMNYFYFEACKIEQKRVVQMLCTSSGDAIFLTPWESEAISAAEERFGFKLRFVRMDSGA
jgi:hypothetical protein